MFFCIVDLTEHSVYSISSQLASLQLPSTIAALTQIPPFANTGKTLGDVHKTGLGSSAALITSLVAALLLHVRAIPLGSLSTPILDVQNEHRALVHNTAQYIHCLAQGKVGSGFDVSSAVYGSHLYTRFDPEVISPLMNDEVSTCFQIFFITCNAPSYRRIGVPSNPC